MAVEEGLAQRKRGSALSKSMIHKVLTNPIYHGEFVWKGKLYTGQHEPIIDKSMFEQVQHVLEIRGQHRARKQKYNWAFKSLLHCGHCGCAFTAEIKKKKYIYYHCTGNRDKRCPGKKNIREEEIARQFGEALRLIQLDEEVLQWLVTALKESQKDKRSYHEECLQALEKERQTYQRRIDSMYEDKLDGVIPQELFLRKSDEYRQRLRGIAEQVTRHEEADRDYIDNGVQLLELAKNAVALYEQQSNMEKRRLLEFVCSNSEWRDGQLVPAFRKPFDLLADANAEIKQNGRHSHIQEDDRLLLLPSLIPQGTRPELQVPIYFRGAIPKIGTRPPLPKVEPLPIQKLILLARAWQKRMSRGEVIRADLAEEHECSRPRVTQILNLLHLSEEVQAIILEADPLIIGQNGVTERGLRPVLERPPKAQLEAVQEMLLSAATGAELRIQRVVRTSNTAS